MIGGLLQQDPDRRRARLLYRDPLRRVDGRRPRRAVYHLDQTSDRGGDRRCWPAFADLRVSKGWEFASRASRVRCTGSGKDSMMRVSALPVLEREMVVQNARVLPIKKTAAVD